jgi:hypothetical protein
VQEPNFCEISALLSRLSDPPVMARMQRIRETSYDIYLRSSQATSHEDAAAIVEIFAAVMEAQANQFAIWRITADAAEGPAQPVALLVRPL